jgi:hypothetical protein
MSENFLISDLVALETETLDASDLAGVCGLSFLPGGTVTHST